MTRGQQLRIIRDYFGDVCQYSAASSIIDMADVLNDPSVPRMPLIVVHLVDLRANTVETKILTSNHCPYVGELLNNRTIMEFSYMKCIKFYRPACFKLGTKCFFDGLHMCLCDGNAHMEYFLFDHSAGNCTDKGYCQNGGHCVEPVQKQPIDDFGCVCQPCFYGQLCQFTITIYSISLDALIGPDLYPDKSLSE
ncbi:unnamed protein product [Didymodactylos carnosus]|uniref:EGF-like domain-containing protein n=1 Tax=Didymodactylos carnosus TaxID=1234261 RepID=A0A8S2DP58_9BILA|nr:unnamed protein product [Didymodactylos carnosus]CAF3715921.1 unnamed protein product [Didymodactylos carnosus]